MPRARARSQARMRRRPLPAGQKVAYDLNMLWGLQNTSIFVCATTRSTMAATVSAPCSKIEVDSVLVFRNAVCRCVPRRADPR
jgi:hypothetical protein